MLYGLYGQCSIRAFITENLVLTAKRVGEAKGHERHEALVLVSSRNVLLPGQPLWNHRNCRYSSALTSVGIQWMVMGPGLVVETREQLQGHVKL